MEKPNIILLTIDTLRRDIVGCYGSDQAVTPNLDLLAEHGIVFNNAITCGSWTQAAFPPILTSTYASMFGGCEGPLSISRPSPVEVLADAGYATAAFSTSPLLSNAYGYQRGFEHFEEIFPSGQQRWMRNIKGGQTLLRSYGFQSLMAGIFGKPVPPNPVYHPGEHVVNAFADWQRGIEGPFFTWLHMMDVHWPYHLEEQLSSPQAAAQAWQDIAHLHAYSWSGAEMTMEQRNHYVHLYQKAVERVDHYVGRLMDVLQAADLEDQSIIIILSDHGEEMLEHGRWGHFENNLHDEILRIPLIVRFPEGGNPQRIDEQVSTLSIMPTILDLCHVPGPSGMLGQSLAPHWGQGEHGHVEEFALSEMWRAHWHRISVRSSRNKLIWDNRADTPVELYDLILDPQESNNIARSNRDVVRTMQLQVNELLDSAERTRSNDPPSAVPINDRMAERLRDLGYLE